MYVGAYYNRDDDIVHVAERINGKRVLKTFKPQHRFYFPSKNGEYTSIFGQRLEKFETSTRAKFYKEKESYEGQRLYESDTNILFRTLYDNYHDKGAPNLNQAMFDIEVDFDPSIGFSTPENPYAPINAISVYMNWLDTMFTLALPPKTLHWNDALVITEKFDNTFLFATERELLDTFLQIVEDVDVFTGWNSTGFDIPYTVLRIQKVLGDEYTKKLCLWDMEPVRREYERFNKKVFTYDLIGKVHLDYLDLYKKNTYQELHSYKLDFVGETEVQENKIPYTGSLYDLYHNDFEKFLAYNRQDTMLLVKIDRKKKFIELHNQLAHSISVDFNATMGSVAIIDQAIINEAHERGLIVFDKRGFRQEGKAAGAYVRDPITGLHKWVGACDINSLYPSVIRSLNMSPETLIGQIRQTFTRKLIDDRIAAGMTATDAWHEMFGSLEYQEVMKRSDVMLTIDYDLNGVPQARSEEKTAKEIYDMVFCDGSNMCLSANGTLFRTDIEGVIPGLLGKWYHTRTEYKNKAKKFLTQAKGVEVDDELMELLAA